MMLERAVLNSLPEAVVLLDASRLVVFANQTCERLLGWRPEDLLSRPAVECPLMAVALSTLENSGLGLNRIHGGELRPFRLERPAASGEACSVVTRSVETSDGRMVLLMFREENTRTGPPECIEMVTAPLIGELAVGAAHEFNNLCTVAVTSFDALLQASSLTEDERVRLTEARSRMLGGAEGLKHLQTYARGSGADPTLVSLNDASELTRWAARSVFGPSLPVKLQLPSDEVLSCEANRRELLLALLGGVRMVARQLDGRGEILLRLRKVSKWDARAHDESPWACFGCLTLEASIAPGVTKSARAGKGRLGLAGINDEEFARALTAWAVARGGWAGWSEGTAVERVWNLVLPLSGTVEDPVTARFKAESSGNTGPSGKLILVADDDSMVRGLVSVALRREGLTVIEVDDGEEAVNRLIQDPDAFGLVVLDLHMPRLGGKAALERIRLANPALKAIFLTGSVGGEVLGFQANADVAWVQKPFLLDDLLRTVRQMLNH